jgi:hypothetical protein
MIWNLVITGLEYDDLEDSSLTSSAVSHIKQSIREAYQTFILASIEVPGVSFYHAKA